VIETASCSLRLVATFEDWAEAAPYPRFDDSGLKKRIAVKANVTNGKAFLSRNLIVSSGGEAKAFAVPIFLG
jgi:hypothetical protein